jgi:nitrogenase subunit NifH
VRKTIFEYAPESNGATDYQRVVEWLVNNDTSAATTAQQQQHEASV